MNYIDKHLEVTGCLKVAVVASTQPQRLKNILGSFSYLI